MKKIFVFSMLISLAAVCSCQKQDSAAERQHAQLKAELDAREKALDEREKVLDEREKALAERENAAAQSVSNVPSRGQVRDPAELQAEKDRRLQQLPADARQLIPDSEQMETRIKEKERRKEERRAQKQRRLEERTRTSGSAVAPAAEATSPSPSPAPQ